jgi:polyprenyl-phospho-N-acetylgalactosaminyl synthase
MKVVAVMPAYQEASRIAEAIRAIRPQVDVLLAVDDGSRDGTAEAARGEGVVVLRHRVNRGQGAALRTGTEAALRLGADVILHIDADGQHDPGAIRRLVGPIREGRADIVFGSRFLEDASEGIPWTRRLLLRLAHLFNVFALGIPRRITDPQNGLRALSRFAAERIRFEQDRMAHCSEILRLVARSGLSYVEVPARVRYTADSLAKGQGSFDAFKIVWQLLIGSFRK